MGPPPPLHGGSAPGCARRGAPPPAPPDVGGRPLRFPHPSAVGDLAPDRGLCTTPVGSGVAVWHPIGACAPRAARPPNPRAEPAGGLAPDRGLCTTPSPPHPLIWAPWSDWAVPRAAGILVRLPAACG
ncbi:hypothetical protein BN12_920007 [Nostocoides japonicum T1-X7]|uniref:Uncharacterized protein n=1 Tax=Nostocoides japonicum T1-X7 TaxID=1194083 RepID=A0A077M8Q3_9MICO|nr:hypothetical protein BN12_920007 [Tetrasphaera japonica T1-X7]